MTASVNELVIGIKEEELMGCLDVIRTLLLWKHELQNNEKNVNE